MASVRPVELDVPGRARRAYTPMPHPGAPGRWSVGAILSALGAWAAETGSPPRRQDWSGERPERANVAQRKWMREHPRWPSSSCVTLHFGSWSRALEHAGLPARCLTFEEPVAERVQTAARMAAAGHGARAIAEHLGVSVSTVYNYLAARTCPQCGGPVASPRATRCASCTASEPTIGRGWSREAVRATIRDWFAAHGVYPTYRDWTPSRARPGRWEADSPRWPSAAVVCELYREHEDPWNAALADAGATPRLRRWHDAAIRAALASFWTRTGRRPRVADLQTPAWDGPSLRTIIRRYGDLERAWQALGPVPGASTTKGERWRPSSLPASNC
jgi:hypothetical protein